MHYQLDHIVVHVRSLVYSAGGYVGVLRCQSQEPTVDVACCCYGKMK